VSAVFVAFEESIFSLTRREMFAAGHAVFLPEAGRPSQTRFPAVLGLTWTFSIVDRSTMDSKFATVVALPCEPAPTGRPSLRSSNGTSRCMPQWVSRRRDSGGHILNLAYFSASKSAP